MVIPISGNSRRSVPGSMLHKWLSRQRPHPDSFDCGIKVIEGAVTGESTRWRYRNTAADRLVVDGVITLFHGETTLRIVVDDRSITPARDHGLSVKTGYAVLEAVEQESAAKLLVSVIPGELGRLGIDLV